MRCHEYLLHYNAFRMGVVGVVSVILAKEFDLRNVQRNLLMILLWQSRRVD